MNRVTGAREWEHTRSYLGLGPLHASKDSPRTWDGKEPKGLLTPISRYLRQLHFIDLLVRICAPCIRVWWGFFFPEMF